MGNKNCCSYSSPQNTGRRVIASKEDDETWHKDYPPFDISVNNLQHISEREGDDAGDLDPSQDPTAKTIFIERSIKMTAAEHNVNGVGGMNRRHHKSHHQIAPQDNSTTSSSSRRPLKKSSSCSTIYLDDSTVSQPNLKNTVKCVALAIYYHIKNRDYDRDTSGGGGSDIDIFDERLHPLMSKDALAMAGPEGVDFTTGPEHKHIYKFVRTLFNAAQLTAECAIITLVYLERLMTYAEIDIQPTNWKRIVLGAILLASKVWDDQAVWNVDYCQILKDITVEDMNELERRFLELLQFNINVPSSVYAKYYFDLRTLAEANDLSLPPHGHPNQPLLSKERALKLEAMSRVMIEDRYGGGGRWEGDDTGAGGGSGGAHGSSGGGRNGYKKWSSLDNVNCGGPGGGTGGQGARRSVAILS